MSASRIFGTPNAKRRKSHNSSRRESVQTQSQMRLNSTSDDNTRRQRTEDNNKKSPQEIRKIRSHQRRMSRSQTSSASTQQQSSRIRRMLRMRRRLRGALPENTTTKRILAISASVPILIWTLPFWSIQLTFWILGLGFIAVESVWIVNAFVPGEELYMFTWMMIIFIGMSSLMFAAIMYTVRNVDCFGGWKTFLLIISIVLYMTPLINFAPWIVVWIVSVIYLQKESNENQT